MKKLLKRYIYETDGFFDFGIGTALLGGALIGGASSALQGRQQRRAADRSNEFTREQLQNRHQWEVDDLRKAGLNPILSAHGTPSIGSSAQAGVPDHAAAISGASSTAVQAKRNQQEVKVLRQQEKKIRNEAQKAESDAQIAGLAARDAAANYIHSTAARNFRISKAGQRQGLAEYILSKPMSSAAGVSIKKLDKHTSNLNWIDDSGFDFANKIRKKDSALP